MFARIVVILAALLPALARELLPWMSALAAASLGISFFLWRREPPVDHHSVAAGANPFELGSAIRFGLVFGAISLGAHAAQLYFGKAGLYLASALAGSRTWTRSRSPWPSSRGRRRGPRTAASASSRRA